MAEVNFNLPKHIAIIMDGNGRWAKKRGYPRIVGHKAGVNAVERVVRAAATRGIRYISLYAFSTENWDRPKNEVTALMGLFKYYVKLKIDALKKENVRLRFSGRFFNLPESVKEILKEGEMETLHCDKIDMIVCLNYGGRQEIIDAVNVFIQKNPQTQIDEKSLRSCLYLPDVPDPDLIIRTSGELRLSNFLLWQSSYSELYFTEKLWPDFDELDLNEAISSYSGRERRYGKT